MKVRLSDHFTFKKIFKLTLAPMLMLLFTSFYSIVDGIFIANYSSSSAFAGVNLIFPIIMIVGGIGFMIGTGGSALVGKLLGQKKEEEAKKTFTMIILFTLIIGVIFSFLGTILIEPITRGMASFSIDTTEDMIKEAIKYGSILMPAQVLFMFQSVYSSFFVVDEKPHLGFIFTLGAGLTNIVLDILFVGVFKLEIVGAAIATICGYMVASIGPTIYFFTHKNDYISFRKTKLEIKPLLQSCFNGSSEFVNNISTSIVSIVFNIQLLKFFGEAGVNAYGIIMYLSFVFTSIFLGYSGGISPAVSYHFGAENKEELSNILKKSLIIVSIFSLCMFGISFGLANVFATLFSNGDTNLITITTNGLRIYAIAFLFIGLSIFISSYFTALNNGLISALISFLRTLVFQIAFVFIFPLLLGKYGIFWAIFGSEVVSILLAAFFLLKFRKRYGY